LRPPHFSLRRVVAALIGNNCMTKATTGASATLPTAEQVRVCESRGLRIARLCESG
jgi:hypothetical protein